MANAALRFPRPNRRGMADRLSSGLGFAVIFVVFTFVITLELEAVRAAYLYDHSLPAVLGRLVIALFLTPFFLIGGVVWCLQLALVGMVVGAVASFDTGATAWGALTKIACVGGLWALDLLGPTLLTQHGLPRDGAYRLWWSGEVASLSDLAPWIFAAMAAAGLFRQRWIQIMVRADATRRFP